MLVGFSLRLGTAATVIIVALSATTATNVAATGLSPSGRGPTPSSPNVRPATAGSWIDYGSPVPLGGGGLSDVSCVKANECWAVGGTGGGLPLIEHKTNADHFWTIVPGALPAGATDAWLKRLVCPSSVDCWATGGSWSPTQGTHAFLEHYDGSSWSVTFSPSGNGDFLSRVACINASNCWAIGGLLLDHYDGTNWTTVADPVAGSLSDITCVGFTAECWAVGSARAPVPSTSQTLVEHYQGGTWAVVASPNPPSSTGSVLYTVACTGPSDCWAVGGYVGQIGGYGTLTFSEHYDGSGWTLVPSSNRTNPEPTFIYSNVLVDVSCASAADCWAVGSSGDINGDQDSQTLVEHNTGGGWNIVVSPNPAHEVNELFGVDCTSSGVCWAVGTNTRRGTAGLMEVPLIEKFNPTVSRPAVSQSSSASPPSRGPVAQS
jgi:hypothetical protein